MTLHEPEPRYVVTRRAGVDTLHRNPGEQCNLDDSTADQEVDEETALALLSIRDAVRCQHCRWPTRSGE